MKKLLILAIAPFFAIAACGNLELVLPPDAVASDGGTGGTGGASSCQCESNATSGERLKTIFVEGTDGSRVNQGKFIDTKTGLPCSFQTLPNGETRCVPDHVAMNTFSDKECKIPVYLIVANKLECVPRLPTFVRFDLRNGADCSSEINGFRIGSANTSEPTTLSSFSVLDENGGCVLRGFMNNEYGIAYSLSVLGGEDDFVKGYTPSGF